MKAIISLGLCLILSSSLTAQFAVEPYVFAVAAGCSNQQYEQTSNTSGVQFGNSSTATNIASLIDDSELGANTVCRMEVDLYVNAGSPTFTITGHVFANDDNGTTSDLNDDEPTGSPLAKSTDTIDSSTISTQDWYALSFPGYALSASTRYWVVLQVSSTDASNNVKWIRTSTGVSEEMRIGTAVPAWGGSSTTRGGAVRLFSN